MRKINDMLKLISPDELNGGNTMKETYKTGIIPGEPAPDISESRGAVKVKRGMSGIIAAALALAVGGGALIYSFSKDKARTESVTPAADSIQTVSAETQIDADTNAERVYRVILSNCSYLTAEGRMSEIKKNTGGQRTDLTALGEDETALFHSAEGLDCNLPDKGEIFYFIDPQNYKILFAQWKDPGTGAVGQFPGADYDRTAFGELPQGITVPEETAVPTVFEQMNSHAKAAYNVINSMLQAYAWGGYPDNQQHAFLPGGCVTLDFDDRGAYADLIYRIEKFNTDGTELTGKVYFEYSLGNNVSFLEWTDGSGKTELWPYSEGDFSVTFGKAPQNGEYDKYITDGNTLGCTKIKLLTGDQEGHYHGVITERSNMPEVFEWYEKFLAANCEPVAFDPDKLMTIDEIGTVISFDWADTGRNEYVNIRTSDMKGANIYVNGRYYNTEDTSVLELLDGGMPPAVQ